MAGAVLLQTPPTVVLPKGVLADAHTNAVPVMGFTKGKANTVNVLFTKQPANTV
jgi:hypothetical protein